MSIAQSVFDIVQEEMARHGVEELKVINLAVGKMAAVVPQHLNMCFGMIADNTNLAGTVLNISPSLSNRLPRCLHRHWLLPFRLETHHGNQIPNFRLFHGKR